MISYLELRESVESEEREEASILANPREVGFSQQLQQHQLRAPSPPPGLAFTPPESPTRPAVILNRFGFDQSAIRDFHAPLIQRVARFVAAIAGSPCVVREIRIVGYADSADVNVGERRALAVQHALQPAIERLWPDLNKRIRYTTVNAGARPISNNRAAAARPLNGRVEVCFSFGSSAVPVRYPALAWHPGLKKHTWSMVSSVPEIPQGEAVSEGSVTPAVAPATTTRALGSSLRATSPDGYFEVPSTRNAPHSCICWIESNFANLGMGTTAETGVFISPRHILTAGHSLFSRKITSEQHRTMPDGLMVNNVPTKAVSVRIVPGRNGNAIQPFGSVEIARESLLRSSRPWIASVATNAEFDFGLITLDARLASNPGFWGGQGYRIGSLSDQVLQNAVVHTAGYPADKCPPISTTSSIPSIGANKGKYQWSTIGVISKVGPRTFTHDMPIAAGQSGSPIWTEEQGDRVLIGIASTTQLAVRFTAAVLAQFRAWMNQDGVSKLSF
jgi:V8-like Glu-specific endopeptidase/outer membrane protein OmpA-like peptidoglycan-associated protein